MPRGTVSLEPQRYELKTALPDGYVVLKRMSYGQVIERRSLLTLGFRSDGKSNDFQGEMAMASSKITAYEFASCIVDHNLEDENGVKMNLTVPDGLVQLDSKIGQEIESYISEMNNFNEEDQGN